MPPPRPALALIVFLGCAASMRAAGTGGEVDYTQRSDKFAAEPTIRPEVRAKEQAESLQNRRVGYPVMTQPTAPAADRRAALDVSEARPKTVLPAAAQQPAMRTMPMSAFSHRVSGLDAKDRMASPPMVAKYQDSLRAAAAINPGHYPVIEKPGLFARLNRFVFQRNRTPVPDAPVVSVSAGKPAQP